jgi:predicted TIM-barrel fold metal-dependent hydrolase
MTDSHIHIGQFREKYYDFNKVFDVVLGSGKIDKIVYSSTSSCIDNVEYDFVFKEIEKVQKKYSACTAMPLFWFIPDYIRHGIKIETAMNELDYGGLKLHTYGNKWDFENDDRHLEVLHKIFDYANRQNFPILIHTGESGSDRPSRFERFFGEYKNAKIILAHSRPADETIEMLRKYPNVFCDTAFVSKTSVDKVIKAGFADRILFGTDFPITHYFNKQSEVGMKKQYDEDLRNLKK